MSSHGVCCHDHDCDEDCGQAFSLYKHIDLAKVTCLNEASDGLCKGIFKPWEQRVDFSATPLQSDSDDPELLLHIPFDGEVKIKSITIVGGPEGTSPASVKLFINREDLDFSTAQEMEAVQEFTLNEDVRGILEYPTRITKFQNVHSLEMYFPESLGSDHTVIYFVGIKGEHVERKREAVHAVYELQPVADASKVPGATGNMHHVM